MLFLASLDEWWQALSGAQQVFWMIAGVSSALFIVFFGLSILGLDSDTDVDSDIDIDTDLDHDTGHDFSIDKDFSALSLRSIIAFLTFFGWTGVYLLAQGRSVVFSIIVALLVGLAAMFLVAYMIFKFAQMEKSTTVNVYNALDQQAEVYLSIPQHLEGKGKVHLVVDGSLHEFDAETKGDGLPSGSQVLVVDILEDQVLLVEPLPEIKAADA